MLLSAGLPGGAGGALGTGGFAGGVGPSSGLGAGGGVPGRGVGQTTGGGPGAGLGTGGIPGSGVVTGGGPGGFGPGSAGGMNSRTIFSQFLRNYIKPIETQRLLNILYMPVYLNKRLDYNI